MRFSTLQRQILYTLAYSAVFNYPLTPDELYQRLLENIQLAAPNHLDVPKVSAAAVSTKSSNLALQQLITAAVIVKIAAPTGGDWLVLAARESGVLQREHRATTSARKWQEVDPAVAWLKKIPWVQAVFITGALAMNNSEADDDIDFMIVTQPRRLWLCRGLILLYAQLQGKRRSWAGEEKNSWCFNLWLDQKNLDVFAQFPSVYTAYEIVQARTVFDRGGIQPAWYQQNRWLRKFLPNSPLFPAQPIHFSPLRAVPLPVVSPHANLLLDGLDQVAFLLQKWYMQPHMTREKIAREYAFFHPRDTQRLIYSQWQHVLNQLADALSN